MTYDTDISPEWAPRVIWRASMIPFFIDEEGKIEMMFMIPSDQRWAGSAPQMAKGRIEDEETHEETAIREAREELGLINGNIEHTHYFGVFLGRTHVYACRVHDKDRFGMYSQETDDVVWMTEDEFRISGRDIHQDVVSMVADYAYYVMVDEKQEREAEEALEG